jgi:hypothetical protein
MFNDIEIENRVLRVFDNGEIYSMPFTGTDGRKLKYRKIVQSIDSDGYKVMNFKKANCVTVNKRVHRLVAEAFLDDWDSALTVDHIDGDKLNNDASNLRMMSAVNNSRSYYSTGMVKDWTNINCVGVTRLPSGNFQARVTVGGKRISLGAFPCEIDAAIAVNVAMIKLGRSVLSINTPLSSELPWSMAR